MSLLSLCLNAASVHDVCCLNKLIHHIKETANQPVVLHKFDLDKMILVLQLLMREALRVNLLEKKIPMGNWRARFKVLGSS